MDHKISIFSGEIKRLAETNRQALVKKCGRMSDRERLCVSDAETELDLGKCEQDKRRKPAKKRAKNAGDKTARK